MKHSTMSQVACCERTILSRFSAALQISLFFVLVLWSALMSAQSQIVPVNDDCSGALAIACNETFNGSTAGASSEEMTFCGDTYAGQVWGEPGVWFTHLGHGDNTTLNLSEDGNFGFDTFVGVYTGECGDLTCVTGDDDAGIGLNSNVTFFGEEGVLYFIYVTGWQPSQPGSSNGDSGPFVFSLECTPVCAPALEIACAGDATIECGQDINDLDLTGVPSFINLVTCDQEVISSYEDVLVSSNDCVTIWARTWFVSLGDLSATCTQLITVIDTQGPVFPELSDVNVQCLEEVPGPIAVTAVDVCSGETSATSFTSQTGELVSSCSLSSAYGPGADWSLWLPVLAANGDVTNANFHFDSNGGTFDQFMDGTAHLYGTVENSSNPSEKFIVDLKFENKADWATWSSMGRNYKNDLNLACATADHINWSYYELVGGFSTLSGADALAGDVLYIYHQPASYYFGFQVGIGANNKNCNSGLSGWFTYEGFVGGESVEGHGDVNVDGECTPNQDSDCIHNTSFTHFYRAVDACGHATIASYDVIVEDTTAPEFNNCPESLTINCEDAIPAVAEGITASDNCTGDVAVSYLGEQAEGNECYTVLTRTWSAMDVCGNRSFCVQYITIVDVTAPVLAGTPDAEITVECHLVPDAAVVTATDNCLDTVIVNFNQEIAEGNCPGNYTIYRTWSAWDNCQNGASFTQTIHVQDTTAPEFDEYEFYAHIECDEIPAVITATDNCGEATVEVTYEILNSGGCLGVYHRIYTATDACGNTATAEQYIAIQDLTAPSIEGVPADQEMECSSVELMENGNYFTSGDVYGVDNCEMEVTISYSEEVVATDDNCPQSYDIIRRWIATDYCENMDTAFQTVHVVDTTAPWFDYVPGGYMISCEETPEYGDAVADDNCGNVSIEVSVDTVYQGCPQSYDIVRTFVATDECGNVSEPATQVIEVRDYTAPYFNEYQEAYTFECDDDIVLVDPIAGDICSTLEQYSYDTEISGDACAYYYYHVTVATDACGNTNYAYQFVLVLDTTAPVIAGELEIEMPCEEFDIESGIFVMASDACNEFEIYIASTTMYSGECAGVYYREYYAVDACGNTSDLFGQIIRLTDETAPVGNEPADVVVECGSYAPEFDPNFTDNCGGEVNVEYVGFEVEGTCNVTYTESWIATDNCGNMSTIDRNVTYVDTQDPWFLTETLPSSMIIECTEEVPAVQYPSAYDVCDMDVEIEFTTETMAGDCPSNYTIYRMFRAFDECGNEAFYTQTITVQDTQAPYFEEQNNEFGYECNTIAPVVTPVAGDSCSEFELTYNDENAWEQGCYYGFIRVWTAEDACGNINYFNQYISFSDNTAPELTAAPEIEIPCEEFDIESGIFASATDNCQEPTIYIVSTTHFSGECAGVYYREYQAYDGCGNWSEIVGQIIRLIDVTAPTGNEPADVTINCDEVAPAFDPEFTDNCGGELTLSHTLPQVLGYCNVSYTESWTATDNCGNSTTVDRVVTIVDNVNPWFTYIPENQEVECNQEYALEMATAADNCDMEVEVSVETVETPGDCPAELTITRTFTATDECGLTAQAVQVINIVDTTAPYFNEEENEFGYECNTIAPIIEPSAGDVCSEVSLTYNDENAWEQGCYYGFVRVWTAEDACGNTNTFNQYISFSDNTAPELTAEAEIEIPCEEFSIESGIFASATDNCQEPTIYILSTTHFSGECAGVYYREYQAYDGCGNWSEIVGQIIRLIDVTAPAGNEPMDITVNCNEEIPSFDPAFTDNCGGEVEVEYVGYEVTGICGVTYTESWIATDNCGNMSTIDRSITVVDNNDPWFTYVPEDLVVECNQDYYLGDAYAADSCDYNVQVTVEISVADGECPAESVITRTFTATDACGNTAVEYQTISIVDTTAPYFYDQNNEFAYQCIDEVEVITPMAGDDCSAVELDYSDSEMWSEGCSYGFVRNWVAIDACGNVNDFNQYIYIYDYTAPTIVTELSDVSVECASEIPAPVEVIATDNCDQEVTVVPNVEVVESDDCGNQVLFVSYYAYDNCGNYDYAYYYIYVNDVTAPEMIGCPSNIVLACDAEIPAPAEVTAIDNCQGAIEPIFEEYMMGEMPAEGSIADCDLMTPDNSNALCAAAAQGQDWAMVLFGMPTAHKYYHVTEGNLVQYPDGSIHVEATMASNSNPANGFYVNVYFNGGMTWSEFTSQGFPTNFKADCDGVDANHEDWLYFYLTASEGAELTGFGGYTGSSLNLVHAPANNYFGFQLGNGANNLSASENGFGGWFSYSGTFIVNEQAFGSNQGSVTGSGDLAFDLDCCPDYYIVRQWTATDCSGNDVSCMQYITFEGTVINDNINIQPTTPEVAVEANVVAVYPNPATDNATFTFKSTTTAKSKLEIFDLAGAKVAEVFNGKVEAGMEYKVDVDVQGFATGVYMFRLTTGEQTEMGRLIINK